MISPSAGGERDHPVAAGDQRRVVGDHQDGGVPARGPEVVHQRVGGRGGRGARSARPGSALWSPSSSRARASRRASPPETRLPCGPTRRSSASREPTRAQRGGDLVVGGVAVADPEVLRHGGVEEVRVLGQIADRPATSTDRPAAGAARAAWPHRGLADATGPDQGDPLAGRDRGRGPDNDRARPGQPAREAGDPTGPGIVGSAPTAGRSPAPTGGASSSSPYARQRDPRPTPGLDGGGQGGEHLVQGQRGEREHGELDRVAPSGDDLAAPSTSRRARRRRWPAAARRREPAPAPPGARPGAAGVDRGIRSSAAVRSPRTRSGPARRRWPRRPRRPARPAAGPASDRAGPPAGRRASGTTPAGRPAAPDSSAGGGRQHRDHRGGRDDHHPGGGDRDDRPDHQVLDRLDVVDHPGQQVAAAPAQPGARARAA